MTLGYYSFWINPAFHLLALYKFCFYNFSYNILAKTKQQDYYDKEEGKFGYYSSNCFLRYIFRILSSFISTLIFLWCLLFLRISKIYCPWTAVFAGQTQQYYFYSSGPWHPSLLFCVQPFFIPLCFSSSHILFHKSRCLRNFISWAVPFSVVQFLG
jgi:hypothetical protein